MDGHMDVSLLYPNQGGWLISKFKATNVYKPYYHDMVEARIHFRLGYISLLYVYKVFKPLPVQWMDIWMYPYCIATREVGWWAHSGQLMGTNHTTTTWVRLGSTSDWIKLPFHKYIKCLSSFQCNEWTYGCILTVSQPGRLADWLILGN